MRLRDAGPGDRTPEPPSANLGRPEPGRLASAPLVGTWLLTGLGSVLLVAAYCVGLDARAGDLAWFAALVVFGLAVTAGLLAVVVGVVWWWQHGANDNSARPAVIGLISLGYATVGLCLTVGAGVTAASKG
ncbi:MAG: hypothetical protein K2X82_21720 [Gemmataceae bacterium]|nr:hypothetical protein [Gemmataceae bacterium]